MKYINYFRVKKPSITHNIPFVHLCFVILFTFILILGVGAEDYTLEYSEFGLYGAVSQTTNYEVVDLIKEQGVSSGKQSSTDYLIETTTGLTDEPVSVVLDWYLY